MKDTLVFEICDIIDCGPRVVQIFGSDSPHPDTHKLVVLYPPYDATDHELVGLELAILGPDGRVTKTKRYTSWAKGGGNALGLLIKNEDMDGLALKTMVCFLPRR